jgi:hypothetical protein
MIMDSMVEKVYHDTIKKLEGRNEELVKQIKTLAKINEALLDGKPSGLNIHQARVILGELQDENKRLKEAFSTSGELRDCHDCGAKPGEPHKAGCDTERCSVCGGQRLLCNATSKCKGHDPLFARWTGIWPGGAEAKFLGLTPNDLCSHEMRKIFFIKPGN